MVDTIFPIQIQQTLLLNPSELGRQGNRQKVVLQFCIVSRIYLNFLKPAKGKILNLQLSFEKRAKNQAYKSTLHTAIELRLRTVTK